MEMDFDDACLPALTEELQAELNRRIDDLEANPNDGFTWEEIVAHVRRPR